MTETMVLNFNSVEMLETVEAPGAIADFFRGLWNGFRAALR